MNRFFVVENQNQTPGFKVAVKQDYEAERYVPAKNRVKVHTYFDMQKFFAKKNCIYLLIMLYTTSILQIFIN